MKRKTLIAASVGAAVLVIGGGYGVYHIVKSNADPVDVISVSSLNSGWWGDGTSTSGTITANANQEVHLTDGEVIDKVYVKEGDKVKIGDKLLAYDTTLLELDLESEKLDRQSIKLNIKAAQQELEKLKKITPIADNQYGDASDGNGAVLVKTRMVMTATESEPGQTETSAPETQPPSSEPAQTETKAPETSAPETQPETQPGGEIPGPDQETESEKSPLSRVKAYKKLNYDSKPYKGTGTKDDPYVFFCKEGTTIYASFMNKMLGFNESGTSRKNGGMNGDGEGSYAILEIREGDSVNGGFVKSISINGTVKADKPYAPDITWTFGSDGVTKNVPQVDEPEPQEPDDPGDDIWGGDDLGDDVYTVTELKEAIKEKEDEIKDLKLDLREANIRVKQAKRKTDAAVVKASINGVVKAVGDPEVGEVDGKAFISVTSNEGMYVRGTINELKLGEVKVGTTMTGMSYESGMSFTAEITEISEYPDTENDYYNSGEPTGSKYPFMAYIEDSTGLTNMEWVDLTLDGNTGGNSSAIYLYKAYIRSENGQSYVYKADENNRLVKQYVKTGATVYSTNIEIKSGLSLEDKIAFPYGKNVVEGAKVKIDEDETGGVLE